MTLHRWLPALAFLGTVALAPPGSAQSIPAGAIAGRITGEAGEPLGSVRVELRSAEGGLSREVRSGSGGTFHFRPVVPGDYEILAERLGYRPVLLRTVPARPGHRIDVEIRLRIAAEAVESADTVAFGGEALAAASRPGADVVMGGLEQRMPQRLGDLSDLVRHSPLGGAGLAVEGLPETMGEVVADGLPFRPARGAATGDGTGMLLFPYRALAGTELAAGRPDVEWPGAAGSIVSTMIPGREQGAGGELGGFFGDQSFYIDDTAPDGIQTWSAGGAGAGFLVDDSAHVRIFGDAASIGSPVGFWRGGVQQYEAVGLDVAPLASNHAGAIDRLNVGGTFDLHFAGDTWIDAVALYGQGEQDFARAAFSGLDLPVSIDARDLLLAASATAGLSDQLALQVRAAFGQSSRDYAARSLVDTDLDGAGIAFGPGLTQLGGDPAYPAVTDRSDVTGLGALHVRSVNHHVKVGFGLELASHERSRVGASDGFYLFSSPADYASRTGVFWGTTGSRPTASFSTQQFFVFGQDTWRVGSGLDFTTGLRYEAELLPKAEITPNQRWQELTGIDNTALRRTAGEVALVAGFDWNVREQHQWRVRGDLAIQIGDVAPELLGEALTYDGRVAATGAVGDVTAPLDLGPRLTILSRELSPPVTTRASLGFSRTLGSGTVLHLSGVFRETDNLPTRADLNLPADAPYRDQYGRPVYGRLERVGQLVYPQPGSNRRFGEFDAVSAISGNATSTYFGVTAALEKRLGYLRTVASYTYSNTRDDWLATPNQLPLDGLDPFPGEDGPADWEDGVSDFDKPHRFTLATEWTLPFAPMVTLGGFWRIESGRPFTPGFGRAIDANGDGVAGNDPAFVDESIEGVQELQGDWECLRTNAGQLAERNSCRLRSQTLLDAWLGIRIPGVGPVVPELRIEALALDGEEVDRVDAALYRLDPTGTLTVDDASGEVNVPLVVNPRFGTRLSPVRELTRFRVSLRMVF